MKTFAERLSAAIEATDEKAVDIARATNIPVKTIADFCSGVLPANANDATSLADCLGCDVNWLLRGEAAIHGSRRLLIKQLELATIDAVDGVVTLKPDDYRRIYALACMGSD